MGTTPDRSWPLSEYTASALFTASRTYPLSTASPWSGGSTLKPELTAACVKLDTPAKPSVPDSFSAIGSPTTLFGICTGAARAAAARKRLARSAANACSISRRRASPAASLGRSKRSVASGVTAPATFVKFVAPSKCALPALRRPIDLPVWAKPGPTAKRSKISTPIQSALRELLRIIESFLLVTCEVPWGEQRELQQELQVAWKPPALIVKFCPMGRSEQSRQTSTPRIGNDREWGDYRVKVRPGQVKFRQKRRTGSEGQEWNSGLPCAKEGRQGQEGSCAE